MFTMKLRKMRNKSFQGFTLIELLVVIAIIAILAAILFPVFAKAREKARQTACLSNMKQISLGLLQYTQDYDEYVPFMYYGPQPNAGGGTSATLHYKWMDAIYTYVKSEAVFNCPDMTYPKPDAAGSNFYEYHYRTNLAGLNPAPAADAATTGNFYYGSYGYNGMYRNDNATSARIPPCGINGIALSSSAYISPATTVWIVDGVNYYAGWDTLANQVGGTGSVIDPAANPPAFYTQTPGGSGHDLVIARHSNFTNVLFCDGHVKSTTLGTLQQNRRADGTLISFIIEAQ